MEVKFHFCYLFVRENLKGIGKQMKKLIIAVYAAFIAAVFSAYPAALYPQNIKNIDYLKADLEMLASDSFAGRETATTGEDLAAEYISGQLKQAGIMPFGDNGTYYQYFPLVLSTYTNDSKVTIYTGENGKVLNFGASFLADPRYRPTVEPNTKSEIIFAGYGITAAEYGYDDYKNLDVKGKTVLLLDDEPVSTDTAYFRGEKMTRYSFWGTKVRTAKANGAAGVIILPNIAPGSTWDELVQWSLEGSIKLAGTDTVQSIPVVGITDSEFKTLLSGEKVSYDEIMADIKTGKTPVPFLLAKAVSYNIITSRQDVKSKNVVGIAEGTDPVLKNEYIVLSAHYDHEGVKNGEIYNGADDNASGTVAVMEAARWFAQNKNNKRSVIFLLVSGEERGLLGSKYYTNTVSYINNIVVNLNMDMIGRESIDTLHCIGSDRLSSELYTIVENANKRTSKFVLDYRFNDPNDPNRFYERSDHYNFAKRNIPVAFFFDYMNDDYHKPTDDAYKINYEKIMKVTDLVYNVALDIANLDHRLVVDKGN
jgi:hypothetical protein